MTDYVTYDYYITVHLRKRKSDHGRLKAPSTSSITYWQIEKYIEPLSGKLHFYLCHTGKLRLTVTVLYIGQTVKWEESWRIKHLPTRLYLAVTKNEKDDFQVWYPFNFIYNCLLCTGNTEKTRVVFTKKS